MTTIKSWTTWWSGWPPSRRETGGALRVAVDFHGRVHKTMAKLLMKKLEPYDLLFVEEPVLAENEEALAELARCSNIPIATGERNYTRWGFKRLLTGGAVDILQPDVSHAGGIWETRKIAAMAEAFDVALAPHCPLGPHRLGQLPAGGFLHAQRLFAGAKRRHPLQHRL